MDINRLIKSATVSALIFASVVSLPACSGNETATLPDETVSSAPSTTKEQEALAPVPVTVTETAKQEELPAIYGTCGDSANWKYSADTKTLDIYGEGKIDDPSGWSSFAAEVVTVNIENDITDFDLHVFDECKNAEDFSFPYSIKKDTVQKFRKSKYYLNRNGRIDGVLYRDGVLVSVDDSVSGHFTVKEGTTAIGEKAFLGCENIISVTIPDSVKSIGAFAFGRCINLEEIFIGKGTETIHHFLFEDPYAACEIIVCRSLKRINVDKENAHFTDEKGILYTKDKSELIKIPSLYCEKSYLLPLQVTLIRPSAFAYCTTLESVIMDNYNIKSLDNVYFSGCEKLETVVLPPYLVDLGNQTFKFSGIKNIVIPDSVTVIGQECFAFCDNLETVTIGSSVSEIDEIAFAASFLLEQINVSGSNSHFSSLDGVLFNKNKTELLFYPYAKKSEQYNVPDSVTVIDSGAFNLTKNLKRIYIGKNVKTVESGNVFCYEISREEFTDGYIDFNTKPCEIYYAGTQKQWIQINEENSDFDDIESKIYYNSSKLSEPTTEPSTVAVTEKDKNNFWDWF